MEHIEYVWVSATQFSYEGCISDFHVWPGKPSKSVLRKAHKNTSFEIYYDHLDDTKDGIICVRVKTNIFT